MRAASAPIGAAILTFAVAFGAFGAGCARAASERPVGVSDAVPERSPPVPPPAPRAPWVDFAAARAWPEGAPPVVALVHHRDGRMVHVRVEPQALSAYRNLAVDSPMPDGARVVAWHETRAGDLLGGYLLEKRAGVWSAREIDAAGALVDSDAAVCLRCHEMAPTDYLFGLAPRVTPAASAEEKTGESKTPSPR